MTRAVILLLLAAPLFAQKADETAIRELVAKYVNARETQDPKATEALFTADADQLVSSGEWRKGRPAVVKGTMASSQSNSGHRTLDVDSIRFLTPDAAIADCRYTLAATASSPARNMWSTIIATRTKEGWRIAGIRNMLPSK